jgi:hypothetical protein
MTGSPTLPEQSLHVLAQPAGGPAGVRQAGTKKASLSERSRITGALSKMLRVDAHLSESVCSLPELAPHSAQSGCRLPGFTGPFPPPVWMSERMQLENSLQGAGGPALNPGESIAWRRGCVKQQCDTGSSPAGGRVGHGKQLRTGGILSRPCEMLPMANCLVLPDLCHIRSTLPVAPQTRPCRRSYLKVDAFTFPSAPALREPLLRPTEYARSADRPVRAIPVRETVCSVLGQAGDAVSGLEGMWHT